MHIEVLYFVCVVAMFKDQHDYRGHMRERTGVNGRNREEVGLMIQIRIIYLLDYKRV